MRHAFCDGVDGEAGAAAAAVPCAAAAATLGKRYPEVQQQVELGNPSPGVRSPGARSWETSGPTGPGGAGSGVPGTRLLQVAGKAGLAWDGKHKRSIKGEKEREGEGGGRELG